MEVGKQFLERLTCSRRRAVGIRARVWSEGRLILVPPLPDVPQGFVIFPLALEIWWFGGGVIHFNMRLYVYHGMLIWSVLIQGHEGMPERWTHTGLGPPGQMQISENRSSCVKHTVSGPPKERPTHPGGWVKHWGSCLVDILSGLAFIVFIFAYKLHL